MHRLDLSARRDTGALGWLASRRNGGRSQLSNILTGSYCFEAHVHRRFHWVDGHRNSAIHNGSTVVHNTAAPVQMIGRVTYATRPLIGIAPSRRRDKANDRTPVLTLSVPPRTLDWLLCPCWCLVGEGNREMLRKCGTGGVVGCGVPAAWRAPRSRPDNSIRSHSPADVKVCRWTLRQAAIELGVRSN